MKRITLTLAVTLLALISTAAPVAAWPWTTNTPDCTTTTRTRSVPAGFRSILITRKTTVCRGATGHVTSIRVDVREVRTAR